VNFAGTATSPHSTISKYWWYFPGGTPNSSTKATPGAILFPSTGMYVPTLTVVDALGVNDPSPPLRIIQVQPDRLTATINSPVSGATVSGTAVSITASATGITGTSNSFVFVVDGTSKKTVTTAATNATYSWSSKLVANGTHTLTVNVTDANGDFGTQSATVTVAN
jgi:large repetitive protein